MKDFDLYLSLFIVFLICLLALKCITIHKVPKWYLSLTWAGAESIRLLGETCMSTSPRKAKQIGLWVPINTMKFQNKSASCAVLGERIQQSDIMIQMPLPPIEAPPFIVYSFKYSSAEERTGICEEIFVHRYKGLSGCVTQYLPTEISVTKEPLQQMRSLIQKLAFYKRECSFLLSHSSEQ